MLISEKNKTISEKNKDGFRLKKAVSKNNGVIPISPVVQIIEQNKIYTVHATAIILLSSTDQVNILIANISNTSSLMVQTTQLVLTQVI